MVGDISGQSEEKNFGKGQKDAGEPSHQGHQGGRSLEQANEKFTYSPDFHPQALLEKAFNFVYDDPLSVKIWFSADQVRYVKERKWANGQSFTDQPDGSTILAMETSGVWDVRRWVLSFGVDAEVLEPVELREEMKREIKGMGRRYN